MGVESGSRGLSPVSRLWDEQLEFGSSAASSTPSLHSCSLRETSASGKLEAAVANHLQSKPSGECLVCRVCSVVCGFGKETLNYFVWRHWHEAEDPRGWMVAGRSGTVLPRSLPPNCTAPSLALSALLRCWLFPLVPNRSGVEIEAAVAAGERQFLGEGNH